VHEGRGEARKLPTGYALQQIEKLARKTRLRTLTGRKKGYFGCTQRE
jgi:hypothetical protein